MSAILLLTATAFEQQSIVDQLTEPVRYSLSGRQVSRGRLRGRPVWVLEGGLGAVNTAHALTVALQTNRPELVLQIGVGGAYATAALAVGDLVIATEENYGDLGVRTPEGWQSADAIGIPVLQVPGPQGGEERYFNRFPLEENLVTSAGEALGEMSWADEQPGLAAGPFVTVQECSGTAQLGSERAELFSGALCENMEGAAAAHICRLYATPFLEVRAISNQVEDRRRETWDLPLAAARAQQAAVHLIGELKP